MNFFVHIYQVFINPCGGTRIRGGFAGRRDVRLNLGILVTLLIFFAASSALAQTGRVSGRITSAESGEPLAGANLVVEGTDMGTATDQDGEYEVRVPVGQHTLVVTYMGYQEDRATVTVRAGERVTQNFSLQSTTLTGGEVLVTGLRRGQVLSVNEKREAMNIVDVISADEMGKLPDLNVAESAQRISGVTIRTDRGEGRYVSIRGTSPNRSNVQFNGQTMASAAGSRATALDLVPSEMVSEIKVVKAVTPDMEGNALGGTVDISTLTAFDREDRFLSASFNGLQHQLTSDFGANRFPFRSSLTTGTKFGANNEWGVVLSGLVSRRNYKTATYRPNDWINVSDIIVPEEYEMDVEANDRWRYSGNLNLDYRPTDRTSLYSRLHYSYRDESYENIEVQFDSDEIVPIDANTGRVENFQSELDIPNVTIDEKLYALTLGAEQEFGNSLTWDVAGTYTQGVHDRLDWQPEWGYDQAFSMSYDLSGDQPVMDLDDPAAVGNPENYLFDEMDIEFENYLENTYQFETNLQRDYQVGAATGFLKAGAQALYRDKDIDENENPWAAGDTPLTLTQFAGGSINLAQSEAARVPISGNTDAFLDFWEQHQDEADLFALDPVESSEEEVENDAIVSEGVYAGYLMGNIRLGRLTTTGGLRLESTRTTADRYRFVDDPTLDQYQITQTSASNSYVDYLPSLHLIYRFRPDLQIRGAWSNTIGRPDYEELSAFQEFEFEEDEPGVWQASIEEGNPDLEPFRAMNFDVSAEYYWGTGGLVSVGAFYKRIRDPIYQYEFIDRDVYGRDIAYDIEGIPEFDDRFFDRVRIRQRRNADEGTVQGVEISFVKIMDFLPGFLSGLGISSNLAIMESSVTVPGRENEDLPFFDQSDLVYNLVPYYQAGPLELRFAMNHQSEYLDEVADDPRLDEYDDVRQTFDLTAKYRLMGGRLSVNAYGRNLTNEPHRSFQGIRHHTSDHTLTGRTFELGLTYRL
ncbi:MAG TPA: TonB-dependent receptor [bacterium]|nr:TonB-dependent receptor [bacterium]